MNKQPSTFSQLSIKIAATVIAGVILSLGAVSWTFITDKVDKQTYEQHCIENKKRFEDMQNQINQQVKINSELLKALNDLNIKVEVVKTNTEWLIKENKK